jgi:hypothetical protein
VTPDLRHRMFAAAADAWFYALIFAVLAPAPRCTCFDCSGPNP